MARQRSPLAPLVTALVAVSVLWQLHVFEAGLSEAFIPSPALASRAEHVASRQLAEQAALGAFSALMASPLPAFAQDEEEGPDGRVFAVLALPLLAISWALFNVWRSAFRQVVRFTTSKKGGQKEGLSADD